jgi:hypothetical protein
LATSAAYPQLRQHDVALGRDPLLDLLDAAHLQELPRHRHDEERWHLVEIDTGESAVTALQKNCM